METPIVYNTNKTLLKVTLLAPLRELKIKCFPQTANQTFEEFSSMHGYYLIDVPLKEGYQEPIRDKAIEKISAKIFNSELTELGIPPAMWPNIHDYDQFKRYFKIEFLSLIADFGTDPIVTNEIKIKV